MSESTEPIGSTSRRKFLKLVALSGGLLSATGLSPVLSSQPGSPKNARASSASQNLSIRLAGYPFDRVKGLVNGKVKVKGCDSRFEKANIYKLNAVAMGGDQRWEVQEIGLHPFMLAYANTNFRDYTLIPVFPLRTFRHKSIFIHFVKSRVPHGPSFTELCRK